MNVISYIIHFTCIVQYYFLSESDRFLSSYHLNLPYIGTLRILVYEEELVEPKESLPFIYLINLSLAILYKL